MNEENVTPENSETPPGPVTAEPASSAPRESANGSASGEPPVEKIGSFPPEIASLLIVAGVAGMLLPGPVGTPLVIAGGVVLWPKTFRPIEDWFCRRFPKAHREGVNQLKEFLGDLNRRFPEQ